MLIIHGCQPYSSKPKINTLKQPLRSLLLGTLCSISLTSFAGGSSSSAYFGTIKMFSAFIKTAAGNMADGNRVVFAPNYSNAVDGNDAIKLTNPGENFGLVRSQKTLAVEARQPISNDTLFYKMTNLVQQNYLLMLVPQNLEGTASICELIDNYRNTRTVISLTDTTKLTLTVNSDPGSKAANRLMIVFREIMAGPLPVKFTSISAEKNGNAIGIQWKVENELNISSYQLERSSNGQNFISVNTTVPSSGVDGRATYQQSDLSPLSATAYYRVKAINVNGKLEYSAIVKTAAVDISKPKAITLYPNPATDRTVQVQFSNFAPGSYTIKVSNIFGQPVYTTSVKASGSNFVKAVTLPATLSKGNYSVMVIGEEGKAVTQQLVIN